MIILDKVQEVVKSSHINVLHLSMWNKEIKVYQIDITVRF